MEIAGMGALGYTGVDNLEAMRVAVNYRRYLVGLIRDAADATTEVVDFGAGDGTYAEDARSQGLTVHCVELDPQLRRRLQDAGFDAVGSIDSLTGPPAMFIYSFNVLEHIQDDLGTLRSLRDALEPPGRLLLYVPAFMLLFGPMDRKVGHLRRYRRRSLMRLVSEAGFEVEECRYADSLGFLAAVVYRVAGNRSGALKPSSVEVYDRWVFPLSRILDQCLDRLIGKNLVVWARLP